VSDALQNIGHTIQGNPALALLLVFWGGLLTAANPCVIASVPLVVAFVSGSNETTGGRMGLVYSAAFVLGLSTTFAILGLIAARLGGMFGDVGSFWKYIAAGVLLLMGLSLLGVLSFEFTHKIPIKPRRRGLAGAYLLGMLFGTISTPCAAPILVVLLTYVAATGANLAYGALLLLTYGLGHSVLILAAGTSVGLAKGLVSSERLARVSTITRKAAGLLACAVGIYILWI
jgi:cytochrome c-type biogenesis protein